MFKFRWILLISSITILCGIALGFLHYNHDSMNCQVPKEWHWGSWHTPIAAGRFELRYKDLDYGCPPNEQYDPKIFKPYDPSKVDTSTLQ